MKKPSASKTTLADTLVDQIRKAIITGEFQPGEKINIKELTVKYGVSETPLRTALNRLLAENLIDNYPRQGMCVRPINIETCRETFELRRMIELYYADKMTKAYSVDLSFRRALADNISRHNELISSFPQDISFDDYMKSYNIDMAFHSMLLTCACNKMLMSVYHNLNPFQYIYYVYDRQSHEKLMSGVDEHRRIIDALDSGDSEQVKERLAEHLDAATDSIITILKISGFESWNESALG